MTTQPPETAPTDGISTARDRSPASRPERPSPPATTLIATIALLACLTGRSDAGYSYTVTVDQPVVTIMEGGSGLVTYTFTNTGTEPIWVFDFGITGSEPVLPDPLLTATPQYVGPDLSEGMEVYPGGSFKFQYFLTSDQVGPQPPGDSGAQIFVPNIAEELSTTDDIAGPPPPEGSGPIASFEVIVLGTVPEPNTLMLTGIGTFGLIAYWWRRGNPGRRGSRRK